MLDWLHNHQREILILTVVGCTLIIGIAIGYNSNIKFLDLQDVVSKGAQLIQEQDLTITSLQVEISEATTKFITLGKQFTQFGRATQEVNLSSFNTMKFCLTKMKTLGAPNMSGDQYVTALKEINYALSVGITKLQPIIETATSALT